MNTITSDHIPENALLDDLESLVLKQMDCVKKNDMKGLGEIIEEVDALLNTAAGSGDLENEKSGFRLGNILGLQKKLILTVNANKENMARQLQRISEGKKSLRAYRNNV